MKLKEKLALEYVRENSISACASQNRFSYQSGWDAALEWAAKNADTKTITMTYVDIDIEVVDPDTILAGKDVTA